MRPGAQEDLVDEAVGAGGKPANILWNQAAQSSDSADHGARFDGSDLKCCFIDGG